MLSQKRETNAGRMSIYTRMENPFFCLAVVSIVSFGAAGCSGAPELTQIAVVDGFAAPESVYFDSDSQRWFVSNIGADVPGDGFISRLDADGAVLEREFVTGLDDPKGMASHDGVLWVSDMTSLVRIPIASPSDVTRIAVPNAAFLNDVAVDRESGDVYVSDTFGNAVYRVRGDEVSEVLRSAELQAPNGLLAIGRSLVIASIGPDLDPVTFATSAPGRLLHLDLDSLELTPLSEPIGLLDGLERLGSGFIVSDFAVGLYYVRPGDPAVPILDNAEQGLGSSADIGLARSLRTIAVPELTGTRVLFYRYDWRRSRGADRE
jgi:hypothetical protein